MAAGRRRLPEGLRSAAEFRRDIRVEKLRSMRRAVPFCVLRITLSGHTRKSTDMVRLIGLVSRHVRATDVIGRCGRYTLGVMFVDTPEMGGRCALDRLEGITLRAGLQVEFRLRVQDSDAWSDFDSPSGTGTHVGVPLSVQDTLLASREAGQRELTHHDLFGDTSLSQYSRLAIKRGIDIVGASLGLGLTWPILLVAMIIIRRTSPGPAIFRQMREGRDGKPFVIYKLRTMRQDAEALQGSLRELSERDGPAFKMRKDPRVTAVGAFLRRTCIDELPQLFNVLKGDMSLVGPRPLPVVESRQCLPWHRRRLRVRPGITCHWQINKHKVETFDQWMRLDLSYVDRATIWGDLVLLARTVTVPMSGRGGD